MSDPKDLAERILAHAMGMLSADAELQPAAFTIVDGSIYGMIGLTDIGTPLKKGAMYATVAKLAADHKATSVLLVNDAYMKIVPSIEEVESYKPGQLAGDHGATECIIVACKTRDHSGDFLLVQPYTRGPTGEIEYAERKDSSFSETAQPIINMLSDW